MDFLDVPNFASTSRSAFINFVGVNLETMGIKPREIAEDNIKQIIPEPPEQIKDPVKMDLTEAVLDPVNKNTDVVAAAVVTKPAKPQLIKGVDNKILKYIAAGIGTLILVKLISRN